MGNNGNEVKGGIGLSEVLLVLFITLKLCGVIHWPWLWVLAPLWIPLAIVVLIIVIVVIFYGKD